MLRLANSKPVPGIKSNAIWNCAGSLADAAIAFAILPFVVNTLGETSYGLWALVASLTGCFGMLDLGVRGALGRQLAFHLARRDSQSIAATMSTAVALLCAACAITFVGVMGLQWLFFRMFEVAPEHVLAVRVSLLLAGLNLALTFPISAFDATLWAAQRFDRLNQIDISVSILKATLMWLLLTTANGLVLIPLITLTGLVFAGVLKVINTRLAYGCLPIRLRSANRAALSDIFGFGLWNFVRSLAGQAIMRVPPVAIGAFVSPAAVTPYAVADRLLTFSNAFFQAATGVFTPRSAAYAALSDSGRQVGLLLRGGRWCWALALFSSLGFCFFGRPFIALWLGPQHQMTAWYLAILAIGAIVPLSQSLTCSVLLGIARHQFLAIIAVAQAVVGVTLAVVAAKYFGPLAVCAAMASVAVVAGLGQAWHGCRALRVRLRDYAARAVLPAVATCLVPAIVGTAAIWAGAPHRLLGFAPWLSAYCLLFGLGFYCTCMRPFGFPAPGLRDEQATAEGLVCLVGAREDPASGQLEIGLPEAALDVDSL
jgi:O-antigen/teichoic acid export membrane protein